MNNEQIKLLLKMKKLISNGCCRFEQRSDRNYIDDLLKIGISEEEAWNTILRLNFHTFFIDPKPDYYKTGESLIFKPIINNELIYIKLKIERDTGFDETVCLSFHIDHRGGNL